MRVLYYSNRVYNIYRDEIRKLGATYLPTYLLKKIVL